MAGGRASLEDLSVYSWETASLSHEELQQLESEIGAALEWSEGVPVVTCQRYEIIAAGPSATLAPRSYRGTEALTHIATVAAGIESLVLGESEILGQVRTALAEASPELRRLTAPAIAAARALKREEGFHAHAGHALDLALEHLGLEPEGPLTVVGAGPMGRRTAERAAELGFDVTLVARRPLPLPPTIRYRAFSDLASLPDTDVLVTCLGKGAPALGPNEVPNVHRAAIDLATPRNLVGGFDAPVVRLADLIRLQRHSASDAVNRARLAARVETLLTSRRALDERFSPLGSMREEVERIRQQEMMRTLRLHPDLPPEKLDAITRSLVNQIFHKPSLRLRQVEDAELVAAVAALFGVATEEAISDRN